MCPQERDYRAIEAAGLEARYRVRYVSSDLDRVESFDAEAIVEECMSLQADGVIGTKDRSALLASIVADRRGLPGPRPHALLVCQHKPTARALQHQLIPEATPRFALLSGRPLEFPPPWFVKPVVGRLSHGALRIDDAKELFAVVETDRYRAGYAQVAELAGLPAYAAHGFLVEEFIEGDEVTVEGFVHGGRVTTIGITDSVKYPGTNSFERFEYPSALPGDRQQELADVVSRLLPALDFEDGFFNVEFLVPESGPAKIVEANGRIASQFEPLVRACHGGSTYELLLALACGDDPQWEPGPAEGVAVSYVVRVFDDALVTAVPDPEPGLEILVRPGARLSEQGTNDAVSYRLAIFYEWGETREQAVERCLARAADLRFELA